MSLRDNCSIIEENERMKKRLAIPDRWKPLPILKSVCKPLHYRNSAIYTNNRGNEYIADLVLHTWDQKLDEPYLTLWSTVVSMRVWQREGMTRAFPNIKTAAIDVISPLRMANLFSFIVIRFYIDHTSKTILAQRHSSLFQITPSVRLPSLATRVFLKKVLS